MDGIEWIPEEVTMGVEKVAGEEIWEPGGPPDGQQGGSRQPKAAGGVGASGLAKNPNLQMCLAIYSHTLPCPSAWTKGVWVPGGPGARTMMVRVPGVSRTFLVQRERQPQGISQRVDFPKDCS